MSSPGLFSRRQFLTIQLLMDERVDWVLASESVASTALAHPEWDMDERKPWLEWLSSSRAVPLSQQSAEER